MYVCISVLKKIRTCRAFFFSGGTFVSPPGVSPPDGERGGTSRQRVGTFPIPAPGPEPRICRRPGTGPRTPSPARPLRHSELLAPGLGPPARALNTIWIPIRTCPGGRSPLIRRQRRGPGEGGERRSGFGGVCERSRGPSPGAVGSGRTSCPIVGRRGGEFRWVCKHPLPAGVGVVGISSLGLRISEALKSLIAAGFLVASPNWQCSEELRCWISIDKDL